MTKRDELIALDPAGLEAAVRECARITAPEISDVEYERIKADNSPRYQNTRAEMERTLRAYLNAARSQPNVQPALEAPAAGSNFDGYDVRFHENVLGQLGATTKSDGTASAEGRVQGPDPSVGKTRDILQNRAGVASGPSDTKSASPFLSTLPSGECGPSVTTPEGEVDAPVAFITKSALEKFMKGSEPEQHVLLHRGNDLRAGLYTHPAPSDGAIREALKFARCDIAGAITYVEAHEGVTAHGLRQTLAMIDTALSPQPPAEKEG